MSTPGPDRSVAILGPGAIGGFLAALLWRNKVAVTCVATESAAQLIERDGIRLESPTFGNFTARPKAVAKLGEAPDVLIIATKAPALADALCRIDSDLAEDGVVVPLLNGLEHMQLLRSRFGPRVIAASIGYVEAMRVSPTHVVHKTPSARLEVASDGDIDTQSIAEIAEFMGFTGIETAVLPSEAAVLWGKLVRLNALACTTSASGLTVGEVRSDPAWHARLESAVGEGAAVATAEGWPTDPEVAMTQIAGVPYDLRTSMQRDVEAGRPSEVDAIAGAVVRAGARHNIDCGTIEELIAMIQRRERVA